MVSWLVLQSRIKLHPRDEPEGKKIRAGVSVLDAHPVGYPQRLPAVIAALMAGGKVKVSSAWLDFHTGQSPILTCSIISHAVSLGAVVLDISENGIGRRGGIVRGGS